MSTNGNSDKTNREKLRQSWIEALLNALVPKDHEERITRLLDQIESPTTSVDPGTDSDGSRHWIHWKPLAIAATLLFAVFVAYQVSGPSSAMAAVTRSLDAITQLVPRRYDLKIENRGTGPANATFQNEVYVLGRERFAMKHTGLGADIWMGRESFDDAWIVSPIGPVFKGKGSEVFEWLSANKGNLKLPSWEEGTPFMHIAAALETMSLGYKLTSLPDESILLNDESQIDCQHIRGNRKTDFRSTAPDSIDLWISHELNIPIQLVAQWNLEAPSDNQNGSTRTVTLLYRDEPTLADDWFTAEAHYEGDREVINLEDVNSN